MPVPSLLIVANWFPSIGSLVFFKQQGESIEVIYIDTNLSVLIDLSKASDVD